jgi:hypothetical protein
MIKMNDRGTAHPSGMVDLGDGVFVHITDINEAKLPPELGGGWYTVVNKQPTLHGGKEALYITLAHPEIDVIWVDEQFLWIRRRNND